MATIVTDRRRSAGLRAPRPPFRLNPHHPFASKIIGLWPGVPSNGNLGVNRAYGDAVRRPGASAGVTKVRPTGSGPLMGQSVYNQPFIDANNDYWGVLNTAGEDLALLRNVTWVYWVQLEDLGEPRYAMYGKDNRFTDGVASYFEAQGVNAWQFYVGSWNRGANSSRFDGWKTWHQVICTNNDNPMNRQRIFVQGEQGADGTENSYRSASTTDNLAFGWIGGVRRFRGQQAHCMVIGDTFADQAIADYLYDPRTRWSIYEELGARRYFITEGIAPSGPPSKVGNQDVLKSYVGESDVVAEYVGDTKIWPLP